MYVLPSLPLSRLIDRNRICRETKRCSVVGDCYRWPTAMEESWAATNFRPLIKTLFRPNNRFGAIRLRPIIISVVTDILENSFNDIPLTPFETGRRLSISQISFLSQKDRRDRFYIYIACKHNSSNIYVLYVRIYVVYEQSDIYHRSLSK